MSHPGGRPTKLTPELIENAKGYLPTCVDIEHETDKGALAWVEVNLPTQVGLAQYLSIDKDTVTEWCKESIEDTEEVKDLRKQFSVIVKEIMREQEIRLVNKGLGGLYQARIGGMILSKHGYAEKSEVDLTSKGESMNTFDPKAMALAKKFEDELKKEI